VPYSKPGAKSAQAANKSAPAATASRIVEETKELITNAANSAFDNIQDFILNGAKFPILAETTTAEEALGESEIAMDDYFISHDLMIKVAEGLFKIQKIILNVAQVKRTIMRFKAWMLTFSGNNIEGVLKFMTDTLKDSIHHPKSKFQQKITSHNTLMFRYAMFKAVDRNGKQVFDFFDLMRFTFLLADREGLNRLELDNEYQKTLL